jgi:hypothetical protein
VVQVHYEEFDGEQTTVDAMISRDDGQDLVGAKSGGANDRCFRSPLARD